MKRSLRRFLLIALLGGVSLWWGLVTLWVYREAAHEVEEVYDANLAQAARALMSISEYMHEDEEDDDDDEEERRDFDPYMASDFSHHYETKVAFWVSNQQGQVLLHSPSSPDFYRLAERLHGDFQRIEIEGRAWRVLGLRDKEHDIWVHVGERYSVRQEMIWEILESVLKPLLYALPLLAGLVWFGIGRGLAPLGALGREIARRDPGQLTPLSTGRIPLEIRPIIDALNQLFQRLERAFANERRFTSDAAHELRTPLAGIRVQAEVARRAQNAAQRQAALIQIETGVVRATHLVEQLLSLARMDAQQSLPLETLDLQILAQRLIEELWPLARDKNIKLSIEGEAAAVRANGDALFLLLRNLLDNALRYTPPGGQVRIGLAAQTLSVCDNGPGIPPEQREQLFERFRRGKHQNIQGSGLGLSIVQRIAELHGARLSLSDGPSGTGLCVRCEFLFRRVV